MTSNADTQPLTTPRAEVVIVANALLMGLETSSTLMNRWGAALIVLNITIQALFVVEIALRNMRRRLIA